MGDNIRPGQRCDACGKQAGVLVGVYTGGPFDPPTSWECQECRPAAFEPVWEGRVIWDEVSAW